LNRPSGLAEPFGRRGPRGLGIGEEDLEQTKQHFEMPTLALQRFLKVRGDLYSRPAIGGVGAFPDTGDEGLAGGLAIALLFRPVLVLDGEPASRFGVSAT
jgi:hypothetical protein